MPPLTEEELRDELRAEGVYDPAPSEEEMREELAAEPLAQRFLAGDAKSKDAMAAMREARAKGIYKGFLMAVGANTEEQRGERGFMGNLGTSVARGLRGTAEAGMMTAGRVAKGGAGVGLMLGKEEAYRQKFKGMPQPVIDEEIEREFRQANRGDVQAAAESIAFDPRLGLSKDEWVAHREATRVMEGADPIKADWFLTSWIHDAARMAPDMVIGAHFGAIGGVAYWTARVQPDEYLSYRSSGMSDEAAGWASLLSAFPQALVESVQVGQAFGRNIKDAVLKAGKERLKARIVQFGKDYGREVLEEGVQRVMSETVEDMARVATGLGAKRSAVDYMKNAGQEMWQVAGPMALLSGRHAVGIAAEAAGVTKEARIERGVVEALPESREDLARLWATNPKEVEAVVAGGVPSREAVNGLLGVAARTTAPWRVRFADALRAARPGEAVASPTEPGAALVALRARMEAGELVPTEELRAAEQTAAGPEMAPATEAAPAEAPVIEAAVPTEGVAEPQGAVGITEATPTAPIEVPAWQRLVLDAATRAAPQEAPEGQEVEGALEAGARAEAGGVAVGAEEQIAPPARPVSPGGEGRAGLRGAAEARVEAGAGAAPVEAPPQEVVAPPPPPRPVTYEDVLHTAAATGTHEGIALSEGQRKMAAVVASKPFPVEPATTDPGRKDWVKWQNQEKAAVKTLRGEVRKALRAKGLNDAQIDQAAAGIVMRLRQAPLSGEMGALVDAEAAEVTRPTEVPPAAPEAPRTAPEAAVATPEPAQAPAPAKPAFTAEMYQGRGASLETVYGKEAVDAGRAVPIFGPGQYFAFTPADASAYGKVTKALVELQNPFILDTDAKWFALLRDAKTPHLNNMDKPFYANPKGIAPDTVKLQEYLKAHGNDGIIIKLDPASDATRRLGAMTAHDQVVVFENAPAPALAPEALPAPARAGVKGGTYDFTPEAVKEATKGVPGGEVPAAEQRPGQYGEKNVIVTKAEAEVASKTLAAKNSRVTAGVPLDILPEAVKLGIYHAEATGRKFADWSVAMVKAVGERIRPHLGKLWAWVQGYMAARQRWPVLMTSTEGNLTTQEKAAYQETYTREKLAANAYEGEAPDRLANAEKKVGRMAAIAALADDQVAPADVDYVERGFRRMVDDALAIGRDLVGGAAPTVPPAATPPTAAPPAGAAPAAPAGAQAPGFGKPPRGWRGVWDDIMRLTLPTALRMGLAGKTELATELRARMNLYPDREPAITSDRMFVIHDMLHTRGESDGRRIPRPVFDELDKVLDPTHFGNPSEATTKWLEANPRATAALLDLWNKEYSRKNIEHARREGVKVTDRSGNQRAPQMIPNRVPHIFTQEGLDNLVVGTPLRALIVKRIMKSHPDWDEARAEAELGGAIVKRATGPRFGGLDRERVDNEIMAWEVVNGKRIQMLEEGFINLAKRDAEGVGRFLAAVEAFGQRMEKVNPLIEGLVGGGFITKERGQKFTEYVERAIGKSKGEPSGVLRPLIRYVSLAGLSSLFSGFLKNMLLGLSATGAVFESPALARGIASLVRHPRIWYERGLKSGAIEEGIGVLRESGIGKIFGWVSGYDPAEVLLRTSAMPIGVFGAMDAIERLRADPSGFALWSYWTKGQARHLLEKTLGLDKPTIDRLVAQEKFTEDDILMIGRRAAAATQGVTTVANLPGWMTGPNMRAFAIFYKMAYEGTRMLVRDVIGPLAHLNPGPALRYLAGRTATGETLGAARYLFFRRERDDKDKSLWRQLINSFAEGEGWGLAADGVRLISAIINRRAPRSDFSFPIVRSLAAFTDAMTELVTGIKSAPGIAPGEAAGERLKRAGGKLAGTVSIVNHAMQAWRAHGRPTERGDYETVRRQAYRIGTERKWRAEIIEVEPNQEWAYLKRLVGESLWSEDDKDREAAAAAAYTYLRIERKKKAAEAWEQLEAVIAGQRPWPYATTGKQAKRRRTEFEEIIGKDGAAKLRAAEARFKALKRRWLPAARRGVQRQKGTIGVPH